MKHLATACLVLLMSGTALAQDDETAIRQAAQAYVDSPTVQRMIGEVASPESVVDAMRAQAPNLEQNQLDQLSQIAAEEIESIRPQMEEAMVEATTSTFTLAEIEALTEFYNTSEGASIMGKMQPFMRSYYERIGPAMQTMQSRIAGRMSDTLE